METGMLRIRYKDRKTVFEYRNLRPEEVEEQIASHAQRFAIDGVSVNKQLVRTLIDQSALICEWVENEGTDKEKVTKVKTPWDAIEAAEPGDRKAKPPKS